MIYAILRVIVFAAIALGLGWFVNWLRNLNGEIILSTPTGELPLDFLTAALIVIAGLVLFWLVIELVSFLLSLISFISGDKSAFNRFSNRRRTKKGMNALSGSMVALANGDSKHSLAQAYKAERYLNAPEATGILRAQAALAQGNAKDIDAAYRDLLSHDNTRFFAVKGLMNEKIKEGDQDKALQLGLKALQLNNKDPDSINAVFSLQTELGDWAGARETLRLKIAADAMPKDVATRREAVLALAEAEEAKKAGEIDVFADKALLANRLSPSLVPAAILASEVYKNKGENRKANKALVTAWSASPHPELASAFADLEPNETPEERLKRFAVLTKRQKDSPETKRLKTELLIAAGDFPEARRALGDLPEQDNASARDLALAAAIERGQDGDDSLVRAYLARATSANRGAIWTCSNCGHHHDTWEPQCDSCGAFDTIEWVSPQDANPSNTNLTLLPILVDDKEAAEINDEIDAAIVDEVKEGETPQNT